MHYDEAVAAFFGARPEGTPVPAAVLEGGPARRLRDAGEPLATHPIWARAVNEALAGLGLDFLSAYVWGRAAALGEPTAGAAAAAFGWFEPTLVAGVLGAGQAAVSRATLLEVRDRVTAASAEQALSGIDVAVVAPRVLAAALSLPLLGRPLYAGLRERDLPTSPAAVLQRACELLREARGDVHVAVAAAAGLGPVEMNVLTELWLGMELGSYTGTRGWSPDALAAAVSGLSDAGFVAGDGLTAAGVELRARTEDATDEAMGPAVEELGDDLDDVVAVLQQCGDACLAAGAFPADLLKRAAG